MIFWGSNWEKEPGKALRTQLLKMYEGLSGSPYQGVLTQYFDGVGHISSKVEVTSYIDTSVSAPKLLGCCLDQEVKSHANSVASQKGWARTSNAQFIILPAPGTTYEFAQPAPYCAYHGYWASAELIYAFVPYAGDYWFSACTQIYDPENKNAANVTSMAASHEYSEAATDPNPSDPTWVSADETAENADICASGYDQTATGDMVQGTWDDHQNACSIADQEPPRVWAATKTPSQVGKTQATIGGVVNPEGFPTTYKFEYGLSTAYGSSNPTEGEGVGSGSSFVEKTVNLTGLEPNKTYHYRIAATNSSGTTYGEDRTIQTSKWSIGETPSGEGYKGSTLNGVDCPSRGFCIAVGFIGEQSSAPTYEWYGKEPLIEAWGGANWSVPTAPTLSATAATLEDVSCVSVNWCMAVGHQTPEYPEKNSGLAETWTGSKWSVVSVSNPTDAWLKGVSCTSSNWCVAVGKYKSQAPLVETWDGKGWTKQEVSGLYALEDVSCKLSSACMAVGDWGIGEWWNGTKWSEQDYDEANFSNEDQTPSISCTSTTVCVGIADEGEYHHRIKWEGAHWSTEKGSQILRDGGLSCSSEGNCVAVGRAPLSFEHESTVEAPSGLRLGGEWQSENMVNPLFALEENSFFMLSPEAGGWLSDVACPASTECVAVGGYELPPDGNEQPPAGLKPLTEWLAPPAKVTTEAASAVKATSATLNATVNPEGSATSYYFEYDSSAYKGEDAHGAKIPLSPEAIGSGTANVAVHQAPNGLKKGQTYHYRVVAESNAGTSYGEDKMFTTTTGQPVLSTEAASELQGEGATLNATINPEGASTSFWFEYAEDTKYAEGKGYDQKTSLDLAGSGTSDVAKSAIIGGLKPGTKYDYRVFAENEAGKSYGSNMSFTTLKLPKVTTKPATEVDASSATLNAIVNPEGSETTYWFQLDSKPYGGCEESVHGVNVPSELATAGSGTSDVLVSQAVSELEPGAPLKTGVTYYFRVRAINAAGPANCGEVLTFTTKEAVYSTLCTKDDTTCAQADRYPSNTAFTASVESPGVTIANSITNVTCTESTLAGETSSEAGNPLPLKVSTWSLGGCKTTNGTSCTASTAALPGSASLSWSEGAKGSLSVASALQWTIKCGIYMNCTMSFTPTGTLNGGSPGQVAVAEAKSSESSGFCPATSTFKAATYSLSTPKPVYVKRALPSTVLCKANPEGSICAQADRYPSNTAFTASVESPGVTIANSITNVTCTESTLAGETSSEAGTPLPLKVSTWSLGGCKTTNGTSCTASTAALPGSASLSWSEGAKGSLSVASALQWTIKCGIYMNCTMSFAPTGTLNGGSPGQVAVAEAKSSESSGFCPETKTLKAATYSLSTPKPVYVKRRPY